MVSRSMKTLTNENINLNLVLIIENVYFTLIKEWPLAPPANTARTFREAFNY